MKCAFCESSDCYGGKDCFGYAERSFEAFSKDEVARRISEVATSIESDGYMRWCRVYEVVEFARRMGFRKLGIAFCIGMREEAKRLQEILEKNGFNVVSVCCKMGGIMKEELGFKKIKADRKEAICNPIGQAMALNDAKTDLNLIVGLCVGHDVVFSMYSKAPVTTVVVKDRVLAHNPVGALYSGYYKRNVFGD